MTTDSQLEARAPVVGTNVPGEDFDADAYDAAQQRANEQAIIAGALAPSHDDAVYAAPVAPGMQARQPIATERTQPAPPKLVGRDPPPEAQTPQQAQPSAQPFRRMLVGGGYAPAREVQVLGPTGKAALKSQIDAGAEYTKAAEKVAEENKQADADLQIATAVHQEKIAEQERLAAENQANQARMQRDAERRALELDAKAAELGNMKLDPERWWSSKSDLAKVGWVIGGVLSGIGAGARGGAVEDLSAKFARESDREVARQMQVFNAKQTANEARRTTIGQLMQIAGTKEGAASLLGAIHAKQIALTAQGAASRIGTAEAMAKAAEIAKTESQRSAELIKHSVMFRQAAAPKEMYVGADGIPRTREEVVKHADAMALKGAKSPDDAAKLQHEKDKQEREDRKWLAHERGQQGLPELKTMIDSAKSSQREAGDRGIGPVSTRVAETSPLIYGMVFGNDAAKREQDWSGLKNLYYNKLSGAAVGAKEEDRLRRQLDSARTPRDRMNALSAIDAATSAADQNLSTAVGQQAQGQRTAPQKQVVQPGRLK